MNVLQPKEFTKLGVPDPSQNPEAPDLVLTTGPGYSFADDVTGDVIVEAGHMHATFVAAGTGVRPGVKLNTINNIDVAPTIAHLLGLKMQADGRVLTEALTQ
jgi:hypothetical protein